MTSKEYELIKKMLQMQAKLDKAIWMIILIQLI